MKNTHLEHPEDSILTGDLSVLSWFLANSEMTVKMDGKPAIQAGAPPKDMLKEIIDTRLLSEGCGDTTKEKCCGGGCEPKVEKKEDSVSTFNKIMNKIRSVLG